MWYKKYIYKFVDHDASRCLTYKFNIFLFDDVKKIELYDTKEHIEHLVKNMFIKNYLKDRINKILKETPGLDFNKYVVAKEASVQKFKMYNVQENVEEKPEYHEIKCKDQWCVKYKKGNEKKLKDMVDYDQQCLILFYYGLVNKNWTGPEDPNDIIDLREYAQCPIITSLGMKGDFELEQQQGGNNDYDYNVDYEKAYQKYKNKYLKLKKNKMLN